MMQNFGSNPKMSCKTVMETVMMMGLLYLVMNFLVVIRFDLTTITVFGAARFVEWYLLFRDAAVVFCQTVGFFVGQDEVVVFKLQTVFPDGIGLIFNFDFQIFYLQFPF